MQSRVDMALHLLDYAHQIMKENLQRVTLEEALFVPVGGYRSVLGTLKHAAGWSHVYRSYAFDPQPKHWSQLDWPHGLRDTVIKSERYLHDVIEWYDEAHRQWLEELANVSEAQLDELRSLHWGQSAPLYEIVVMIAGHHLYHAGELNQLLSICRGEAWEETEEVEENNISTVGHRVRPLWLDEKREQ
jgi:hypothetical protein